MRKTFTYRFANFFEKYVPSPLAITVCLTFLTFLLALVFTLPAQSNWFIYGKDLLGFWQEGIWNHSLLVFAYQMMLILVLGHALVLSKPMQQLITFVTPYCNTTAKSASLVAFLTMLFSFFNWGLALIFGALFARQIAESAHREATPIHYPLIGAAGYMGMMVWHGGISGSAPIKITEKGHLKDLLQGSENEALLNQLPQSISFSETVFSMPNLLTFVLVVVCITGLFYFIGKQSEGQIPKIVSLQHEISEERGLWLDRSFLFGRLFAVLLFSAFVVAYSKQLMELRISPNVINLFLFALGLLFHGSLRNYFSAIRSSISDVSDILIQFPLYFGIMGVMQHSGLVALLSENLIAVANQTTLPLFIFVSAGVVNLFVPSGGGQWVIQGPIILEAAHELNVNQAKAIMALAYGDQITNMLQPFWALPLLGITQLKAKQILPFTLLAFLVGGVIYFLSLWLLW